MPSGRRIRDFLLVCLAGMAAVAGSRAAPRAQSGAAPSLSQRGPPQVEYSVPEEAILRMTLPGPLKMSHL